MSTKIEWATETWNPITGCSKISIKGVKGELYPCKPDIFEATYERVAK